MDDNTRFIKYYKGNDICHEDKSTNQYIKVLLQAHPYIRCKKKRCNSDFFSCMEATKCIMYVNAQMQV